MRLERDSNKEGGLGPWLVVGCVVIVIIVIGLNAASNINWHQWSPDLAGCKRQMQQARAQQEKGKYEAGITECEEAIRLAPQHAEAYQLCSVLMEQAGRDSQSLIQMKKAAELGPDNANIQEKYAEMLDRMGENAEAMKRYEQVIAKFPKCKDAYFWYAGLNERTGNYAKGEQNYLKYIKLDPQLDGAWIGLSRCKKSRKDIVGAVAVLKQATSKGVETSAVYYHKGLFLIDQGKKQEGIAALKKAIELEPDSAEFTSRLISDLSKSKGGPVTVPLHRNGDSYLADVVLNGKVHARLIVDSGAEMCAMQPRMAQKLGLDLNQANEVAIVGATGADTGYGMTLASVAVGNAKEPAVQATFSELPDTMGDGLLGMSFLGRFHFTLDPRHQILILSKK